MEVMKEDNDETKEEEKKNELDGKALRVNTNR